MKKISLYITPIISYILAYFITNLEEQIPLYSGSILKIYILKYCFYVFLGIFVCFFSKNLIVNSLNKITALFSLVAILIPIILWLYLIKNNYVGNFYNYFLVYFIYLGGYLLTAINFFLKKGDTL